MRFRHGVLFLVVLALAASCSDDTTVAETTTDTSGDGDGDPRTGGDGDGDGDGEPTTTGDGDGDPSGDGDGEPPTGDGDGEPAGDGDGEPATGDGDGDPDDPSAECDARAIEPYAGPLCGPDELPCQLVADQELSPPTFRNGLPSLGLGSECRPHLLFADGPGVVYGRYNDGWQLEPAPADALSGAMVVDPETEVAVVALNEGAHVISTWTLDGEWTQHAGLEGSVLARGLVRSPSGSALAAYVDEGELSYGTFDGQNWVLLPQGGDFLHANIGVSRVGQAHIVGWSDAAGWQLVWDRPGMLGGQTIVDYGSNSLAEDQVAIAILGGDQDAPLGQPHLLHALAEPEPDDGIRLAYSVRIGPDSWTTEAFADEEVTNGCNLPPPDADSQCNYDTVELHPLGVVTSESGEVRLLWSRIHRLWTLGGECIDGDCFWVPTDDASVGELWISWPTDEGIESALVGESFAEKAALALDPGGRIHVLTYDRRMQGGVDEGPSIHYFRIEPESP